MSPAGMKAPKWNTSWFRNSFRKVPLDRSFRPFCHGEPGSMNLDCTSLSFRQWTRVLAMNSDPLSVSMNLGAPNILIKPSITPIT